jgi:hypothetical protein
LDFLSIVRPRRITYDTRARRNIVCNHRAGAHDRALTNPNAGQNDSAGANHDVIANSHQPGEVGPWANMNTFTEATFMVDCRGCIDDACLA